MESAINMNSLIAIGVGIVLAIIVFKVIKSIIKAVFVVLAIAIALYFWQGGTKEGLKEKINNTKEDVVNVSISKYFNIDKVPVSDLLNTFCSDEQADKTKCKCIVTPVYNDLTSRLSSSDLSSLEKDKALKLREIRNSITNQGAAIKSCGVATGGKKFANGTQWLLKAIEGAVVQ